MRQRDGDSALRCDELSSMNNQESMRDAGTCLGGFLGLFLGAMLGCAICLRFFVDKLSRDDGSVESNQALLPFLGVIVGACVGAIVGALAVRLLFAGYAMLFRSTGEKG
jgi:uncharacterized membrane protein YoaK (UPF0700 family)